MAEIDRWAWGSVEDSSQEAAYFLHLGAPDVRIAVKVEPWEARFADTVVSVAGLVVTLRQASERLLRQLLQLNMGGPGYLGLGLDGALWFAVSVFGSRLDEALLEGMLAIVGGNARRLRDELRSDGF